MPKTILVIEDNSLNAQLLKDIFTVKGYKVRIAVNGEDGLEDVKKKRPDLILMDIQLPGMSGYELTRILKNDEKTSDIPIIAITAYALKGERERAFREGCDEYMSKPINTRVMPVIVEQFIGTA